MYRASTSGPKVGGYAAIVGGVLLIPSAIWASFFASGGSEPLGSEPLSTMFVALGFIGTFLATASVLWLYPLISSEGDAEGSLWASLGVAVTIISLVGLIFYGTEVLRGAESHRLYLMASVLAWWVRPLCIVLFAFSLVRADILFGRALLLFLLAFLEIPLLSNLMLEATAGAGWGTLVFGLTELQSGVLAALAWISFGYSLLLFGEVSDGPNMLLDA